MEDHSLIMIISTLVTALGIKEIWQLVKKRMDIKAAKEKRVDGLSIKVIEELKDKITILEAKIDSLITENTALREKLARMEERLLLNAKTKATRKRNSSE
jgi:regulator of replication initiation timing|tara:strand:- start:237 stop:536 length:300 start_codon:yes stop_codon:yes gene_type:complete